MRNRESDRGRSDCLRGALVAAAATLAVAGAHASVPSMAECLEGSDFIANAALARDHGIARDAFVERLEADMMLIHAFPPELRWFVKDADDERFLRAAAMDVFDRPLSPERHRAAFFAACVTRATA